MFWISQNATACKPKEYLNKCIVCLWVSTIMNWISLHRVEDINLTEILIPYLYYLFNTYYVINVMFIYFKTVDFSSFLFFCWSLWSYIFLHCHNDKDIFPNRILIQYRHSITWLRIFLWLNNFLGGFPTGKGLRKISLPFPSLLLTHHRPQEIRTLSFVTFPNETKTKTQEPMQNLATFIAV